MGYPILPDFPYRHDTLDYIPALMLSGGFYFCLLTCIRFLSLHLMEQTCPSKCVCLLAMMTRIYD